MRESTASSHLRRRRSARDRRVQRAPFHFPERRSGFDRRAGTDTGWRGLWDASMRKYRENKSTFLLVLATIIVFNYVDYLLTIRVLRAGGQELNPIMARLFEISPVVAATAKLGTVGAAVLVLLMLRRYRRTLEASLVLLLAFTALMFYHAALAIRIA
ncbi:MAG: DUF5658 family protein [Acidimicrobiia bacterium]|nr:DUF5658 family protein [Acidimicrobiia bacterium]